MTLGGWDATRLQGMGHLPSPGGLWPRPVRSGTVPVAMEQAPLLYCRAGRKGCAVSDDQPPDKETPSWPTGEPDDSEPTPERQAELRAAYEKNVAEGKASYEGVAIRTRGELL
jgi:hypothetical protein